VSLVTAESTVSRVLPTPVQDDVTYGPLGRLGAWTAGHFRVVLLSWVVVAVGLGVFAPRAQHALAGAGWEASGSESVAARHLVDSQFAGLSSAALQVVVHSDTQTVTEPAMSSVIGRAQQLLGADRRISRVVPPAPGVSISATVTPR
jgi:RND superfamily putative drug exporter